MSDKCEWSTETEGYHALPEWEYHHYTVLCNWSMRWFIRAFTLKNKDWKQLLKCLGGKANLQTPHPQWYVCPSLPHWINECCSVDTRQFSPCVKERGTNGTREPLAISFLHSRPCRHNRDGQSWISVVYPKSKGEKNPLLPWCGF